MIARSDGDQSNQATPVVWYTFVLNAAWPVHTKAGSRLSQGPITVFLANFCTLKLAASACAALGFMLMVFVRRQCGPVGFGPLVFGHVRGEGPARCAQYRRFARHLHAVVRSDLQGSSHQRRVAGTCPGRICHSRYLGRGAPSSPYGAAVELIMLMFRTCCPAQIFLFGAEPTKAKLTSEFLAGPPQRGTIQECMSSS